MAWGTWEELILGGAVLRHGTADWNLVASEIRTRTLYPTAFTPQACKERFQDLQKRYCGSTAWFDELKKRRVAELKQELTKSENSIGSLESKIKHLEVEKQHSSQGLSETESRLPPFDSESISRQTSNDANSVGSFTKKPGTSRLRGHHQTDTKPSSFKQDKRGSWIDKFPEIGYGNSIIIRKKRSQRKRKRMECSQAMSDNLGSSNVVSTAPKETSTNDNNEIIRISGTINHSYATGSDSLIDIFRSVAGSEPASVFKHRMDSQKRARYRRVIKQHMDIGTIRSRIMGQSIKSAKELFRDLLLLANNALVFYSKRTREYKSALSLRLLVMKEYKFYLSKGYSCHKATSAFIPCNPPVKPRTVRPRPVPNKDKAPEKSSNVVPETTLGSDQKQCKIDNNINVSKGLKRPGKVKTISVKQRKRLRR